MDTRLVEVTIRPPRIATFINAKNSHWQDTVLRIIEIYSEIWGGAYDIIVPYEYDEKEDILIIPEIFKQVLEIYDPDYILFYEEEIYDYSNEKIYNKLWSEIYPTIVPFKIRRFDSFDYLEDLGREEYLKTLDSEKICQIDTKIESDLFKLDIYSRTGKYRKKSPGFGNLLEVFTKKLDIDSKIIGAYYPLNYYNSEKTPFAWTLRDTEKLQKQHCNFLLLITGEREDPYSFLLYYNLLRILEAKLFFVYLDPTKYPFLNLDEIKAQCDAGKVNTKEWEKRYLVSLLNYRLDFLILDNSKNKILSKAFQDYKNFKRTHPYYKLNIIDFGYLEKRILSEIMPSYIKHTSSRQFLGVQEGNVIRIPRFSLPSVPGRVVFEYKTLHAYYPKRLNNIIKSFFENQIPLNPQERIRVSKNCIVSLFPLDIIPIYSAFEIFKKLFKEQKKNYSLELSDKGKYFKETLNKFEGINETEKLENLAEFVRSEKYVLIGMYLLKLHNNVTRLVSGKEKKVKTLDIIKWHKEVEKVIETLKKN